MATVANMLRSKVPLKRFRKMYLNLKLFFGLLRFDKLTFKVRAIYSNENVCNFSKMFKNFFVVVEEMY